jgi:hypothetical protein
VHRALPVKTVVFRGCRGLIAEVRGHTSSRMPNVYAQNAIRLGTRVASSTGVRSRFATAFFVWPASPAPSFRPQAPYSSSPRLRTRSSDRVNGAPGVVLEHAHGGPRRDDDLVFSEVDVPGW